MDAGFSAATQAIIKKLQANFKARRRQPPPPPLPGALPAACCPSR